MTIFDILLLLAPIALIVRIYAPWTPQPAGDPLQRRPLPVIARWRLHRGPASALPALGFVGVLTGRVNPLALAIAVVLLAGLVAIPIAYILTDEMIALGRTRPRRWTEFAGVGRRRGGARLQRVPGSRGMNIWLSDSRGDDEFVHFLRKMVRASYKGQIGPVTRHAAPTETDEPPWEIARASRA